jgi:hypothetical protein
MGILIKLDSFCDYTNEFPKGSCKVDVILVVPKGKSDAGDIYFWKDAYYAQGRVKTDGSWRPANIFLFHKKNRFYFLNKYNDD